MKMKTFGRLVMAVALSAGYMAALAQKPALDAAAYDRWTVVEWAAISNNGQYAKYVLREGVVFEGRKSLVLVATSSQAGWTKKIPVPNGLSHFSADSRYLFQMLPGDSLLQLTLGTDKISYRTGVQHYKTTGANWLIVKMKGEEGELIVTNLSDNKSYSYKQVDRFEVNEAGNMLLLFSKSGEDRNRQEEIRLLPFTGNGEAMSIYNGPATASLVFDTRGQQLAFREELTGNVWYYKTGTNKARLLVDQSQAGAGQKIGGIDRFSHDGTRLFLSFQEILGEKQEEPVALNVWTYKDRQSQVQQLKEAAPRNYCWAVNIADSKLLCLQQRDDPSPAFGRLNDQWAFLHSGYDYPGELMRIELKLLNTLTGSRHPIRHTGQLSPGGNYIVTYDPDKRSFIVTETATGKERDLAKEVDTQWLEFEPGYQGTPYARALVAGWKGVDEGVFVYDRFDIWLLDLKGQKPPVNITNGYGRRHHTMFYFISESQYMEHPLTGNPELLLTAFNIDTKDNGFFKTSLTRKGDPEKLIMGPYAYSLSRNPSVPNEAHFEPIRARDAEVYLVQRQDANESLNLYVTRDFRTFTQLSHNYPERAYNWLTTSLHTYTLEGGEKAQGVLYKPENFDTSKKYPVIFYYYSRRSDNLHTFLVPEPSSGELNIPWYVSNGYLVFTPDMHHPVFGKLYEGCLNSIESAARYVGSLPYVDEHRMGIQGISWGGIQTNYYVTHSNLFAAACSASGLGNFLSQYNSLGHSVSAHGAYEHGTNGNGKTIWEDPDWYIRHSPVTNADKATTPLLLMETTLDEACPYVNAFELYNGLRRLGKKVWMLEYTNANHGVYGKEGADFDIRMQQFFGHFLKGEPAPVWMTKGIPARLKGIETGLEYDTTGAQP